MELHGCGIEVLETGLLHGVHRLRDVFRMMGSHGRSGKVLRVSDDDLLLRGTGAWQREKYFGEAAEVRKLKR